MGLMQGRTGNCAFVPGHKRPFDLGTKTLFDLTWFLDEMQRIAFRLMLSSCVCMCMCVDVCFCLSVGVCMPRLWTSGKRFEIETSFLIPRNNTGHNL